MKAPHAESTDWCYASGLRNHRKASLFDFFCSPPSPCIGRRGERNFRPIALPSSSVAHLPPPIKGYGWSYHPIVGLGRHAEPDRRMIHVGSSMAETSRERILNLLRRQILSEDTGQVIHMAVVAVHHSLAIFIRRAFDRPSSHLPSKLQKEQWILAIRHGLLRE